MSITKIHHGLPGIVSKSIVKSMIGSLNATAIAYARMHLRNSARAAASAHPDDVPTIDQLNDEMAAVAQEIERARIADEMGHAIQMPTGELIERLMALRSFYVDVLMQQKATANDMPLTIAETVKFQMDRGPDNNDSLLVLLAEAVDMDVDMLRAAKVQMQQDDAADLRANAAKVVDYLGQYCDVDKEFDDDAVEANFAALPKHVQYKLIGASIRAHDSARKKAMVQLLRGKIDAAGDIKMLNANRADICTWLKDFSQVNQVALDEYVERGGMLPEIEDRDIVTSNKPVVKQTPTPAQVAQVTADIKAPVEKPRMQRAPKPAATA